MDKQNLIIFKHNSFYDIMKEHIELTDVVELVPFERQEDKVGRYYHSYDKMEEVDFIIIDGPDTGRYNIRATTNVVDLHERFPNNKINVFIQGRYSTTNYYIEKYAGRQFKEGKVYDSATNSHFLSVAELKDLIATLS